MPLEDKLRALKERQEASLASFDGNAVKAAWRTAVEMLCSQIDAWLAPFEHKDYVTISKVEVSLSEKQLGCYKCEGREYDFSGNVLVVDPQGTMVVGFDGRVDMYFRGSNNKRMILLPNRNEPKRWQFWHRQQQELRKELTKESFEDVLDEWLE